MLNHSGFTDRAFAHHFNVTTCGVIFGGRGLKPFSYGESAMPSKPVSSPESFQTFDLVQSSKVPFVESSV